MAAVETEHRAEEQCLGSELSLNTFSAQCSDLDEASSTTLELE